MITFGVLGSAGNIAERHKTAIKGIGGVILAEYDPVFSSFQSIENFFKYSFDYCVICSPTHTHYDYIKMALCQNRKIICEKPMVLPWQNFIDDDRINVVLQYKWLGFPKEAEKIKVIVVRDNTYFKSWKGDPKLTGGIFYNIFIHYIMLAIDLKASFVGKLVREGKQVRMIDDFDLGKVDMDSLYAKMYYDILYNNKGVKPKDLFYLNWVLQRCNWKYGIGRNLFDKTIKFDPLNLEVLHE